MKASRIVLMTLFAVSACGFPGSRIEIVDAGTASIDAGQADAAHTERDAGPQCIGDEILNSRFAYASGHTEDTPHAFDISMNALDVAWVEVGASDCEDIRLGSLSFNQLGTLPHNPHVRYQLESLDGSQDIVRGVQTPAGIMFDFGTRTIQRNTSAQFSVRIYFMNEMEADRQARVGKTVALEMNPPEAVGVESGFSVHQITNSHDIQWITFTGEPSALRTNTLIRGTLPTIYYYSNNGKRYVFPRTDSGLGYTFLTWFTDDSDVITVPDEVLAGIAIRGNITVKPGTKLLKIASDPKIYAVSQYGVLHWIPETDVIAELYGTNWQSFVQIVPDVFFIDYTIGVDITEASQYRPIEQEAGSSLPCHTLSELNCVFINVPPAQNPPDAGNASGGTLSFTSLGNDGVVNVPKLVHASETGVAMFKFKVREPGNVEVMTLNKVYFGVKNALNTFASYKLFNEATGQQIGSSNNAIITTGTNGEVRFGGLNLGISQGGEVNLIVKADVVDANMMASTNYDVTMGITFTEFTGQVSGQTTRESGGWIVGQAISDSSAAVGTFVPGGDYFVVNDIANFKVGDVMYLDLNNDGDGSEIIYGPYAEAYEYTVESVGQNAITLSFGGQRIHSVEAIPSSVRITKYPFASKNHEVQEVEPVISGLNVGEGNQVIENVMGVFVIRCVGDRSCNVRKLRFEISGSYNASIGNASFGPRNFKLDRADPVTGARIANTLNAGSSLSMTGLAPGSPTACVTSSGVVSQACPVDAIPLSGTIIEFDLDAAGIIEEVGADSSKAYVVLADTTSIKDNAVGGTTATTQVRMLGTKAAPVPSIGGHDGLVWSYTRTSNGTDSGNLEISDSYIVSGKSLLYQ